MIIHRLLTQRIGQPFARRMRVGHGFVGGEGLGCDDEQRLCRVEALERIGYVRAIDVGNVMSAQIRSCIGLERERDHRRSQVRPADANVDHVGKLVAPRAANVAIADRIGKALDPRKHVPHGGHYVFAVHQHRLVAEIAQGHMEHGAMLGAVDGLARPHVVAPSFDVHVPRKIEQRSHRLAVDAVLGVVEQNVAERGRIGRKPLRIVRE